MQALQPSESITPRGASIVLEVKCDRAQNHIWLYYPEQTKHGVHSKPQQIGKILAMAGGDESATNEHVLSAISVLVAAPSSQLQNDPHLLDCRIAVG